jgi:hypothetical protein
MPALRIAECGPSGLIGDIAVLAPARAYERHLSARPGEDRCCAEWAGIHHYVGAAYDLLVISVTYGTSDSADDAILLIVRAAYQMLQFRS